MLYQLSYNVLLIALLSKSNAISKVVLDNSDIT